MDTQLKIEDYPNLIKDTVSKAVLNTNLNEITEYKRQKILNSDVQKLKDDMIIIQSDLSEIKKLLMNIVNK